MKRLIYTTIKLAACIRSVILKNFFFPSSNNIFDLAYVFLKVSNNSLNRSLTKYYFYQKVMVVLYVQILGVIIQMVV
jgi:hypothetical protein